MGLQLKDVPGATGASWMRRGMGEILRSPLGYASLLMCFLLGTLVLFALPLPLWGFLVFSATPLLSLAFMVATAGRARGQAVTPQAYYAIWLGIGPVRRNGLLVLCGLFGAALIGVVMLSGLQDGGHLFALLKAMTDRSATPEEMGKLIDATGDSPASLLRTVLVSLLNIPFWHALAIVRWGDQGPLQALFSSTVAIWRSRMAFFRYIISFLSVMAVVFTLTLLFVSLMGPEVAAVTVMLPLWLFATTSFYASLYFCFADTFQLDEAPPSP